MQLATSSILQQVLHKKWSFPLKFPADFGTLTEEILNEKLHFLCNEVNFATSNEWSFATSNFCNEKRGIFLQRATCAKSNERILQQVMSEFWQWATSATSNQRILQRVPTDFTSSNEHEWITTSNE